MELGDGNFPAPYPPPPAEPIRIFCPQPVECLRREWQRASCMSKIDWCEDWSVCKIMIFVCPESERERVSLEVFGYMNNFFKRDGRESLVYEYDRNHSRFFEWDHDIFRRDPWRIINAP